MTSYYPELHYIINTAIIPSIRCSVCIMNREISKKKNIFNVFFTEFIRIRGVFTWSAISFIGFILGMSSLEAFSYMIPFVFFGVSTFCILAFTFAINNFYDADSDRKNPRRMHINAIASGKISNQNSIFLNIGFVLIPLLFSFIYKFEVFLFCAFLVFWMWIYSAPPLRLKGRPGIDIIWHFVAFILLILWGSFFAGSINPITVLVAFSVGLWSAIAQIWNHINDYAYDKNSGTVTFAVWAGHDTTITTLKIIVLLHTVFLIPLIVLYSLSYVSTILLLGVGLVITMVGIKPKKDFPLTRRHYIPFVFAIVVYLCCLIYHISILLGEPLYWVVPNISLFL